MIETCPAVNTTSREMKSDQLQASGGCQRKQIANSVIYEKNKQMTSFGTNGDTSYV